MSQYERVSVVTSVYRSDHLDEAVRSILVQDLSHLELIIVDDNPDCVAVGRKIRELAETDGRIRVIRNQRNLGLTKSLNRALEAARGDFIARQDADDVSCADRLTKQVAFLDANRDHALVGAVFEERDQDGALLRRGSPPAAYTDAEIRQVLPLYNPFVHSSVMFRRSVLSEIGHYNERYRYSQDYEYWARILRVYKGAIVPDVLGVRRVTAGAISSRHGRAQRFFALCVKVRIALHEPQVLPRLLPYAARDLGFVCLPAPLRGSRQG